MTMKPDWENVAFFVKNGELPFPHSCVKGVIRKSTLNWEEVPHPIPNTEHPFDIIRDSINRLVRKHQIKKVGIWLSGGIDSSLLTALTAECLGAENVTAYTLKFEGSDETPHAKKTVDHIGCNWVMKDMTLKHHFNLLRQSIRNALAPIGFLTHKLRITRLSNKEEHVFSALGLDELCGGYPAHVWATNEEFSEVECQAFIRANYNFVWINAEQSKNAKFKLHYPYLENEVIGKFRAFPREYKTKGQETKVIIRNELRKMELLPKSTAELGKIAGTKGGFLPNILVWWNQGYKDWAYANAKEGERLLNEYLPEKPVHIGRLGYPAIQLETLVRRSSKLQRIARTLLKRREGVLGGRSNMWVIARLASVPLFVDVLEQEEN